MPNRARGPTFSYDPRLRRAARREHWIPLDPEGGDLRSRAVSSATIAAAQDKELREIEDVAR